MAHPQHLDLVIGPDRPLNLVRFFAFTCACAVLTWKSGHSLVSMFSASAIPGSNAWLITALWLSLLTVTGWHCLRILRALIRPSGARRPTVRLYRSGEAVFRFNPVMEVGDWSPQWWASRWLVIVPIALPARTYRAVICRKLNHYDDFRRLQVWSRFDPRQAASPGVPG